MKLNGFKKYVPTKDGKPGPKQELLGLAVGEEYFFAEILKRNVRCALYRKLRYLSKKHPDIVFAFNCIKNGTVIKRVE